MKKIKNSKKDITTTCVAFLVIAGLYGVSWIATCGIFKLITICFEVKFSWKFATGIWIILCLLKHFTRNCKK